MGHDEVGTVAKQVINWFVMKRPLVIMDSDHAFVHNFSEKEAKELIEAFPCPDLEGLEEGTPIYNCVVCAVIREFRRRFATMEPVEVVQFKLYNTKGNHEALRKGHNISKKKIRNKRAPLLKKTFPRASKRTVNIILEK